MVQHLVHQNGTTCSSNPRANLIAHMEVPHQARPQSLLTMRPKRDQPSPTLLGCRVHRTVWIGQRTTITNPLDWMYDHRLLINSFVTLPKLTLTNLTHDTHLSTAHHNSHRTRIHIHISINEQRKSLRLMRVTDSLLLQVKFIDPPRKILPEPVNKRHRKTEIYFQNIIVKECPMTFHPLLGRRRYPNLTRHAP